MPVARFQMPDGRVARFEVPEGTTPEQAQAMIAKMVQPEKPGALQQGLADLGAGAIRGAGSIGATFMTPVDWLLGNTKSIGNPERRAAMDEALKSLGFGTDSAAFQAGKLGGEIAGTAGAGGFVGGVATKAAPQVASKFPALLEAITTSGMKAGGLTGASGMGVRALGGGITGGAAAGLVNPEDAGTGAAVSAALPAVLQVAGKAGGAIGSALRPDVSMQPLAQKAINQYGIPLGLSDVSASGVVKGARSALDESVLVGGIGRKRKEAVQEAFNKAVGGTFGAPAPKLTPDIVDTAKKRLGSEFDRIWGGNSLKIDPQFVQDLQQIQADAAAKLNPEQAGQVQRQVQNLLQKAQGLDIDGAFANNWQSELRMVAEGEKGLHQKMLTDLRKAAISAFNRSVSPADAAALTMNRSQYKAFKTVEPLLQKSEAGTAGRNVGDISAGLLPEAVRQSYRGGISKSPFADLSQIGSQFVADRVPKTGGSARAAVQNVAIGGGLMANPLLTVGGLGGLAGLEGLLSSPALARRMVSGQPGLLNQLELERLLSLSAPAVVAD